MEKKRLSDDEIVDYAVNTLHLKKEDVVCRDCGKVVRWKNVYFINREKPFGEYGLLRARKSFNAEGLSFMSTRVYNGNKYHLRYCYECARKRYPEIDTLRSPLNPATKRSQFLFDISDEDFSSLTSSVCRRTKENFIKTYGEEEGTRRWDSYCQKQAETNTFEYKQKKYGWNKEKFKKYNASRAVTLPNLIKKHGVEEGTRKFEEYKSRQRYTCSKDYFLEKHGEVDGLKKWDNWQERKKDFCGSSDIADGFFLKLSKFFEGDEIYSSCITSDEFRVGAYRLDYYDKTLNIVVEFYGSFWHAKAEKFETDRQQFQFEFLNKITVEEKRTRDKKRQEYIENILGTKMFIVWEDEYKSDKETVLENLVQQIQDYVKSRDSSYTPKKIPKDEIIPLF